MSTLRPEQLDISTGTTDNDTVGTKGYIDDAVENGADFMKMREIGTPTYETIQDFIDISQGSSLWSGFTITDGGSGTINIAAGTGMIKSTNSGVGENYSFDFSGATGLALTDNSTNYIYIDYNSGSPVAGSKVSLGAINLRTEIVIGRVYRSGTSLNILEVGQFFEEYQTKACRKDFELYGFQRASGEIIGETGTRNITVSAGVDYCAHNRITTPAIDTSVADTFDTWNSSASVTPDTTGISQVDNANYWNGASLVALTANRYGTRFFYRSYDGNIHMQYGTSNAVTQATALAETIPTPPNFLRDFSLYIGRIVIQQGSSTFAFITNPFETQEQGTAVTDHGNLAGLSDDDHLQYALLAGRTGGQTIYGSDTTAQSLILKGNSVDDNGIAVAGDGSLSLPTGTSVNEIVTSVSGSSTDDQLATAKAVYDNDLWITTITGEGENVVTTLAPKTLNNSVRADGGLVIGVANPGSDYTTRWVAETNSLTTTWFEDEAILQHQVQTTDTDTTLKIIGNGTGKGNIITDNILLTGQEIHNVTTVSAATYDLLESDYILHVTYTSTGAVTINLPSAQAVAGRVIHIKDAGGNAGINNIIVNAQGGTSIDGSAIYTIYVNYDAISAYSDGSNWFISNRYTAPLIAQYNSSDGVTADTSTTYQQKVRLVTSSLLPGDYTIFWTCELSITDPKSDINTRVQIDDTTTISEESGRVNELGLYDIRTGFIKTTISSGSHNIDLDYSNSNAKTLSIRRARIELFKN